ncbi:hypothetical protein LF817_16265 [Halobacillus sp. A1]|uniref:hypothetical protein n=1 Tax=Halobacillus sp. A1 TaxID=2880262 RepID=UPI0020A69976|nr:hypothetical protein [Halobacillus sp. A1]MCP3032881.1 hypothetical protein [Halobacillus sp. A1]
MKKIIVTLFTMLLLIIGIPAVAMAEESDTEIENNEVSPMAVPGPEVGSDYIYMGKQEGHSIEHTVTSSSFAIAFGSSERLLSQVFGIGGSLWNWLSGGYEPTPYAKIYSKISVANAYKATLKSKYLWYEDSQFNTYQETTERNESVSCGSYNPYCWED